MDIDAKDLEERWRTDAVGDLDLARRILKMGKHARAMFFVHLALEKALKALVIRATGKTPPRIHNLLVLAERAGVALDNKRQKFLSTMNHYQVAGRYLQIVESGIDSSGAIQDLKTAERTFEWLINL